MDWVEELKKVVAKLRSDSGCPWDREQTHLSILPDFIEEVYEFIEAVEKGSVKDMQEELGDILMQIVFHSQIAEESDHFSLQSVAKSICEKLIYRHPHVFGEDTLTCSDEVIEQWERLKRAEKDKSDRKYLHDGIPKGLPALIRAQKIQKRASSVGFDWSDTESVLEKIEEEIEEFKTALKDSDRDEAELELGDILFSIVNLSRKLNFDAEKALQKSSNKFLNRFKYIEDSYNRDLQKMRLAPLEELDSRWDDAKRKERELN